MNLTPMQEKFMQQFFKRQREISKEALETTKLLSKTNITSILWAGLDSPPTQDKMEETLDKLQAEREKQDQTDLDDITALQKRKKETLDGDQV